MTGIPVTLSEVLEVKGRPITEDEAWALITCVIRPLEEIAHSSGLHSLLLTSGISPEMLLLYANGTARFESVTTSIALGTVAVIPALLQRHLQQNPENITANVRDKLCVFHLGALLRSCVMRDLKLSNGASSLFSFIRAMTSDDPDDIPSIRQVAEFSEEQVSMRGIKKRAVLIELYQSIMGDEIHGDDIDSAEERELLANGLQEYHALEIADSHLYQSAKDSLLNAYNKAEAEQKLESRDDFETLPGKTNEVSSNKAEFSKINGKQFLLSTNDTEILAEEAKIDDKDDESSRDLSTIAGIENQIQISDDKESIHSRGAQHVVENRFDVSYENKDTSKLQNHGEPKSESVSQISEDRVRIPDDKSSTSPSSSIGEETLLPPTVQKLPEQTMEDATPKYEEDVALQNLETKVPQHSEASASALAVATPVKEISEDRFRKGSKSELNENDVPDSVPVPKSLAAAVKIGPNKPQTPVLGVTQAVTSKARQPKTAAEMVQRIESKSRPSLPGPEFLHKMRLPSVRLKAYGSDKQGTLTRSGTACAVLVVLLNGQRIEVTCLASALAAEIFESVVAHTNLTEHFLFGLTYLNNSEHYFLEPEDKLSKFAPPDWKEQFKKHSSVHVVFNLYLRVKYYPYAFDFVKNDSTLHQIYLQLRRDIIDERLRTNRELAFTLAALALQAEYGDRTTSRYGDNYFQIEHYLPPRHLPDDQAERERLKHVLSEVHIQYSGLDTPEAEYEFQTLCQGHREHGIHFHRIFRTKPQHLLVPNPLGDPDTGALLWIGIMPKGIILFEERGGERLPINQFPWRSTQALRFDRKKLTIVSKEEEGGKETLKKYVFYTDHFQKSSYFVKFSAAQHHFSIKVQKWMTTVPPGTNVRRYASNLRLPACVPPTTKNNSDSDSGISREDSPEVQSNTGSAANNRFTTKNPGQKSPSTATKMTTTITNPTVLNISTPAVAGTSFGADESSDLKDSVLAEKIRSMDQDAQPTTSSNCQHQFSVTLAKAPATGGLGLTLVDGVVDGVAGVYIKAIADNGPAQMDGRLKIGDRLIGINGRSLDGKNRHDAVEIVRLSQGTVHLDLARIKLLDDSAHVISEVPPLKRASPMSDVAKKRRDGSSSISERHGVVEISSRQSSESHGAVADSSTPVIPPRNARTNQRERSVTANSIQTPPTRRQNQSESVVMTSAPSSNNEAARLDRRESLVSSTDAMFSAALTSTPLIEAGNSGSNKIPLASQGDQFQEISGVSLASTRIHTKGSSLYGGLNSSSDEDESENENHDHNTKDGGHYHVNSATSAATRSYSLDMESGPELQQNQQQHRAVMRQQRNDSEMSEHQKVSRLSKLDWTDEIDAVESEASSALFGNEDEMETVTVVLTKNAKGGLGIKVAGGKGQKSVYVKALVDEPALSCGNLRPNDRISAINVQSTEGFGHAEVVALLKSASSPVKLVLKRPKNSLVESSLTACQPQNPNQDQSLIEVQLEKPENGSLGLSLAKRAASENDGGIYIKLIAPGSIADVDGRLLVGDRLCKINGQSVECASPQEVVSMLKATIGTLVIVVRRTT